VEEEDYPVMEEQVSAMEEVTIVTVAAEVIMNTTTMASDLGHRVVAATVVGMVTW
jgi:hypothetical protein